MSRNFANAEQTRLTHRQTSSTPSPRWRNLHPVFAIDVVEKSWDEALESRDNGLAVIEGIFKLTRADVFWTMHQLALVDSASDHRTWEQRWYGGQFGCWSNEYGPQNTRLVWQRPSGEVFTSEKDDECGVCQSRAQRATILSPEYVAGLSESAKWMMLGPCEDCQAGPGEKDALQTLANVDGESVTIHGRLYWRAPGHDDLEWAKNVARECSSPDILNNWEVQEDGLLAYVWNGRRSHSVPTIEDLDGKGKLKRRGRRNTARADSAMFESEQDSTTQRVQTSPARRQTLRGQQQLWHWSHELNPDQCLGPADQGE